MSSVTHADYVWETIEVPVGQEALIRDDACEKYYRVTAVNSGVVVVMIGAVVGVIVWEILKWVIR